jgi:hypothetical protein
VKAVHAQHGQRSQRAQLGRKRAREIDVGQRPARSSRHTQPTPRRRRVSRHGWVTAVADGFAAQPHVRLRPKNLPGATLVSPAHERRLGRTVTAIHGEVSKRSRSPFPRARTDAPGRHDTGGHGDGRGGYAQLVAGGRAANAGRVIAVILQAHAAHAHEDVGEQHQHEQVEEEHRSGEKVCAPTIRTTLSPHHISARHHTRMRWERWKITRAPSKLWGRNEPRFCGLPVKHRWCLPRR